MFPNVKIKENCVACYWQFDTYFVVCARKMNQYSLRMAPWGLKHVEV